MWMMEYMAQVGLNSWRKKMSKFKVGDTVRCLRSPVYQYIHPPKVGELYKIYSSPGGNFYIQVEECHELFFEEDFELVKEKQPTHNGEIEKMNFVNGEYPKNLTEFMEKAKKIVSPNKEEFDATRLGYYKMKNNEKVLLVHRRKNLKETYEMLGVHSKNEYADSWSIKGENQCKEERNLVEYLGPELPSEPRKFEFEAYLGENPSSKAIGGYFLDELLGHDVSESIEKKAKPNDYEKISKWKFTMTEIIE